jgi:hypothetical protein
MIVSCYDTLHSIKHVVADLYLKIVICYRYFEEQLYIAH